MTARPVHVTDGFSTSSTAQTASVAPLGTMVTVAVIVADASGPIPDVNDLQVAGLGLTWNLVETRDYRVRRRIWLFAATGNASPGQITITYSGGNFQEMQWSVTDWRGVDESAPFGNTGTNAVGTGATSLTGIVPDTPDPGDAVVAVFGVEEAGLTAQIESGWTVLSHRETDNVRQLLVGSSSNDTSPTVSWNSTATGAGVVAAKVTAAGVNVREFNGDGYIELAPGALTSILDGAWTVVALVYINSIDAVWQSILSFENSESFWSFEVATTGGGELFIYADGDEAYGSAVVAGTWLLVAVSKTSGNAVPRTHVFRYDTETWTHDDADAAIGDISQQVQTVAVGAWERTNDNWDGRIAAAAVWDTALSDGALEGLTERFADWLSLSPSAAWLFGDDPVVDVTEGGADQTSAANATVVIDKTLPFDVRLDTGEHKQGSGEPAGVQLVPDTGIGEQTGEHRQGSGEPAGVQLNPDTGVGSSGYVGQGNPVTIILAPDPGEGTITASGGGLPAGIVLNPEVGSGTSSIQEVCLTWTDGEHLIRTLGPDGPMYVSVCGSIEWQRERPFTAATGVMGGRYVTSAPPGGRNIQLVTAVRSESELDLLLSILTQPLVLISPADSEETWAAPIAGTVQIIKIGRLRQVVAQFIATGPEPPPQLADIGV